MFGDITSRLTRRILIALLLIGGSVWLGRDTTTALLLKGDHTSSDQLPTVIITPQPGAPLQIISTWVESGKPDNFRLVAQVQNQSNKGIRAYTLNSLIASDKQQNGRSQFMNLTQSAAIWQPTEIRTIEVSDSQDNQIKRVTLTLDFVEFVDGTEWGPDSANSHDLLAGQREGAKLTRRHLHQVMRTQGLDAVVVEIKKGEDGQSKPTTTGGHSNQWAEGFRNGVASVRRRISNAISSGNKDRIKTELDRIFDTSGEDHKSLVD